MVEAKLQSVIGVPAGQKAAAIGALVTDLAVQDIVKLINIVASEATSIQDAKPILEALTKDLAKFKNDDTIAIC